MKSSTFWRASESLNCLGGDFMKNELGASSGPPWPRSRASLIQRMASMTIPAELGESSTDKRTSIFIGTSPKWRLSIRMKATLLSLSQGT